ncbi:MAG: orotidine-5'-phosphate decarboxylase [Myxococcales bacterium]|nr:orotidine-5'-phosphate decarboxylase [Myxococcota bacterium]MDW8282386.1 orotidine-5'-phosphate decarboxylase [Myxococcales bacterium]
MLGLDPASRLVIALDHPSLEAALAQVDRLAGLCRWYKVGLELFTAAGPASVRELRARGMRVLLDLKLHDIPETVGRAVRAAAATGAELLTVHAAGGEAMLRRAVEAARQAGGPRLLGVTVLTSTGAEDLPGGDPGALVRERARLCQQLGLAGVVASPLEAAMLRQELGPELCIVTPGVRPAGAAADDQRRTATAAAAIRAGADLIVVGRPVRDAPDPRAAAAALVDEIRRVLEGGG